MNPSTSICSESFHVPALDCSEEFALIKKVLKSLPGVLETRADYLSRHLLVELDTSLTSPEQVEETIQGSGFEATWQNAHADLAQVAPPPAGLNRSTWLGAGLLVTAMIVWSLGDDGSIYRTLWSPMLAVVSAALSGFRVARSAWRAVRLRAIDMNVLMTLAVFGALLTRDFLEAATAMFLFSFSLMLESRSIDRARRAVDSLVRLTPQTAHRLGGPPTSPPSTIENKHNDRNDEEEENTAARTIETVPATALLVGEQVLVKPGERIPVDGKVLVGESSVDQSPITGESLPVDKIQGDKIYAGTLNGEGSLEIEVTRKSGDSTLAQIAKLVQQAQTSRGPTERFVDLFAKKYTPVVIVLALLLATVPPLLTSFAGVSWPGDPSAWDWFHRALVLLVIACPCALVISTPVTIVCGLNAAARRGMIIKGGEHLENAAKITAIAFDKTGTLTTGKPTVTQIELGTNANSKMDENTILSLAAALESRSEHPLAAAIVAEAQRRGLMLSEVTDFVSLRGLGVEGTIEGVRYFIGSPRRLASSDTNGTSPNKAGNTSTDPRESQTGTAAQISSVDRVLGTIWLDDTIRNDAEPAITKLSQLGISQMAILTGDRLSVAECVADQLRKNGARVEVFADLLPEDKVTKVSRLLERHPFLAVVGDGVNDAPALATARLGIAMGSDASDTALETADVVITTPRVARVAELVQLGRRCRRLLRQNISLALITKAIVLTLAAAGWATMWMAVAADVGASLLVIANGMRILGTLRDTSNNPSKTAL